MSSEINIQEMLKYISGVTDPLELKLAAQTFLEKVPPERALEISSALNFGNPFCIPNVSDENAKQLAIAVHQFAELIMRARITCHHADQPNILVACAPKSASTFIWTSLIRSTGLPGVSLSAATMTAQSSSQLGMNLREQETDELALIRNGINGMGYVAQHHIRCTPYLCRQMNLYRIKPIVTYRNFFDTLVSLDDMFLDWRSTGPATDSNFFDDGLPANFAQMEREDRLHVIADRSTVFFIQFYLTWKKCEAMELVKPLWVSYETDFHGDKKKLSQRISDFVGGTHIDADKLAAQFGNTTQGKAVRLNKGTVGRGHDIPQSVREKVLSVFSRYDGEADFSELLGPV
jgi:hypothetical protein